MKNVRKAGAAVEGAEASGKEAAGGRTAKGAAKASSGRRSAASPDPSLTAASAPASVELVSP